jgi:outer membrane protein assembly factor BamB
LNQIDPTPVTTAEIPGPLSLIKQLFKPGQVRFGSPIRLWKSRIALAASLVIVFGVIAWGYLPDLPVRQKLIDLLAQVVAYYPVERDAFPHVLSLRWHFRGEGGISSAPVAANGMIYAGSNAGYLYALDAESGQEVWRFQTRGGMNLAPAVANGVIYTASDDGYLYAIDGQTGQEKWQFKGNSRFSLGPVIAAGTVFVGAEDGSLYALDAETAHEKWEFRAGSAILPYASVAGSTLYAGSQDHNLYALNVETGQEKWRFKAGNWISAQPVEFAGLVYVGSHDENLYVLDAETGREQRRYSLASNEVRTSATLAGGMIYFGSYDSYLHAVDGATGEEKWRFKMGKQTRSAPIVAGGVIYIGGGDGYLYEVDAQTGAEIARYETDSQIYTAPAVVGNIIYFSNGKGELYAVQRTPLSKTEEQPETELSVFPNDESAGFQLTPGAWYVEGKDAVFRFRGRVVDGHGNPVNGVSIQAYNGSLSLLSPPSGPNGRQPKANEGKWEIVIPDARSETGWWWLTAVRSECAAETGLDPQCQQFTRLSETVKVEIKYPDETVINADWTCQWGCQDLSKR